MTCGSLLRLGEEKIANRSKKQALTQDTFGKLFLPIGIGCYYSLHLKL